jgi:hypothetical protein
MTPDGLESIPSSFKGNAPATETSLSELRESVGIDLPDDYLSFLRVHDGGEGFFGDSYLMLWRAGELIELNRAYEISVYAPGLFAFGSDGGGEAFAFDFRSKPPALVSVPFVGMDLGLTRQIASDFRSFLRALVERSE